LGKLIPLIWIAVVFQAISGFTLWMSKPAQYLGDVMFDSKFTPVIIACFVMWYFHSIFRCEVAAWDLRQSGPRQGRGSAQIAGSRSHN
jgi:hypothetical protein